MLFLDGRELAGSGIIASETAPKEGRTWPATEVNTQFSPVSLRRMTSVAHLEDLQRENRSLADSPGVREGWLGVSPLLLPAPGKLGCVAGRLLSAVGGLIAPSRGHPVLQSHTGGSATVPHRQPPVQPVSFMFPAGGQPRVGQVGVGLRSRLADGAAAPLFSFSWRTVLAARHLAL